jgi:hypothetical protein
MQGSTQPAGLHAHDRISLGIKVRVAAQGPHRNGVLFNRILPSGQGLSHHKAQKTAALLGNQKPVAGDDPFQLSLNSRRLKS